VGDRVRIDGRGVTYVVVEVNEETESVSVIEESEVLSTPLDKVTPVGVEQGP
jgi:hypothetical protein